MQSVIQYNIKRAGKKDVRQWLEVAARDIPVREGGKKKNPENDKVSSSSETGFPRRNFSLVQSPFWKLKIKPENALSNLSSFHAGPALWIGQDQMASKGLFKPEFSKIP